MKPKQKIQHNEGRVREVHQAPEHREGKGSMLFLDILSDETGISLADAHSGSEPLALMSYGDELAAKERAFRRYWQTACGGDGTVRPVARSPKPRGYRTTTKRRASPGKRVLLRPDEGNHRVVRSLLEPAEHIAIYEALEDLINEPVNREISKRLNFAIVRGNYESFCVIFNVDALSGPIVKGYLKTAERLAQKIPAVTSAFLYHDPSRSKYYLETNAPADGLRLKKLFGAKFLSAKAEDIEYSFGPTAFSQVNLSIAGTMLSSAKELLSPAKGSRLVDLYCGYGFFSCYLAPQFDDVIGLDYEYSSVDSAQHNITRARSGVKAAFHARRITAQDLAKVLPKPGKPEYLLLDPPRKGCAPGVITYLAGRSPVKVLHVFCGMETIPLELRDWRANGYFPRTVQPLDMFPGTPNLEVMVVLEKKR